MPDGMDGTGSGGGGDGPGIELGQNKVKSEVEELVVGNVNDVNASSNKGNSGGGGGGGGISGGSVGNEDFVREGGGVILGGGNVNIGGDGTSGNNTVSRNARVGGGGGGTILFVGDLLWWTTDAELEVELSKYGPVKEVKFFDDAANGKSKGYCQVEFYDPAAAAACQENMNGHVFNGRPCVVAHATPNTVRKMGEAQFYRNLLRSQALGRQARRGPNGGRAKTGGSNISTGGNYQGVDSSNTGGQGRGNWDRGNAQGIRNRPAIPNIRPGGVGGLGITGRGGNVFGQGIGGTPYLMYPRSMGPGMGFSAPMGRMGSYGGFPGAPVAPFSGVLSPFPLVGGIGLPGVAPYLNPAFLNNQMPMSGIGGMMPTSGTRRPNMGMWSDSSMGGWGGEKHGGRRAGESSYREEAASGNKYGGDISLDRGGGWRNSMKEKDRTSKRDWSGSSGRRFDRDMPREKDARHDHEWAKRRHRDDRVASQERDREHDRYGESSRDRDRNREHSRDQDRERSRYRDHQRDHDKEHDQCKEDRGRYADHHRCRDHESDSKHDDDGDRGQSSRSRNKSRSSHEEEHRSRSRDDDKKRHRQTSE